jgi:hypothetical protein
MSQLPSRHIMHWRAALPCARSGARLPRDPIKQVQSAYATSWDDPLMFYLIWKASSYITSNRTHSKMQRNYRLKTAACKTRTQITGTTADPTIRSNPWPLLYCWCMQIKQKVKLSITCDLEQLRTRIFSSLISPSSPTPASYSGEFRVRGFRGWGCCPRRT